ncbi:hypothetical protein KIN20_032464 [Parelaphostrongylus tenuis]|uniref:Transposase n=1 Tax=Parelaphostrongylus tenuis TaxID=148309 RepID=A0AAD5R6L5_PARTN|nr:hypothetical protein KIN20_032464 [Parelaphostrongylus tenuis]
MQSHVLRKKSTVLAWEHLDHPPYSPELSPPELYLFRSLEQWFDKNAAFRDINHLCRELTG